MIRPGEVHSTYRGCLITRAGINGCGIRWTAYVDGAREDRPGFVRADSLAGLRALIRHSQGVESGAN